MSWIRSAVNKAVEVGNKNNLTRTVKNYADSVVQQAGQAVAEGTKLLQDRIVNLLYLNFLSFHLWIRKKLTNRGVFGCWTKIVTISEIWLVWLLIIEVLGLLRMTMLAAICTLSGFNSRTFFIWIGKTHIWVCLIEVLRWIIILRLLTSNTHTPTHPFWYLWCLHFTGLM